MEQNFNPGLALIGLSGTGSISWTNLKMIKTDRNGSFMIINILLIKKTIKKLLIRSFSLMLYHILVPLSGKWSFMQKIPSSDLIYRLAALRPKKLARSLRNSWGWLVANLGHLLSEKLNIEGRLTTTQQKKKKVKRNPRLSQILYTVFLYWNM